MSYIGNRPSNNFVSLKRQDITGDGTSSYTLDYSVSSTNDIAVYISNVRQDPADYTVSGTTLTTAGNVASTQNFYVIFLGQGLSTQNIPEDTINGKTALTTLATDDELLVYDTSATSLKKITRDNLRADLVSGGIGQVVTATTGTDINTTSSSYVDTGLSLNITPASTSSKILLIHTMVVQVNSGRGRYTFHSSEENGTLHTEDGMMTIEGGNNNKNLAMHFVDSPSTTSQVTYKVQFLSTSGGTVWANVGNAPSIFTAMEILG